MRKILILGFAAVLAVLTLGLSTGSANAAATGTTTIWVGLGVRPPLQGSYDACTGAFSATGATNGATGTYAETVTGTYNKATGASPSPRCTPWTTNGVVDDSTGVNNSAYAYTLTGNVADNWVTGSFTVTKTPVGGTPVTSDSRQRSAVRASGSRSATPAAHAPCRPSSTAATTASASPAPRTRASRARPWPTIAKVVTKVGAYGSATCAKV